MVASAIALQTLTLLPELSLRQFCPLKEDVTLSIAADNILGKMKDKR